MNSPLLLPCICSFIIDLLPFPNITDQWNNEQDVSQSKLHRSTFPRATNKGTSRLSVIFVENVCVPTRSRNQEVIVCRIHNLANEKYEPQKTKTRNWVPLLGARCLILHPCNNNAGFSFCPVSGGNDTINNQLLLVPSEFLHRKVKPGSDPPENNLFYVIQIKRKSWTFR